MSLGKVARSTSSTLAPCLARSMAVGAPAHRAPTTITSYAIHNLPRESRSLYRAAGLQSATNPRRDVLTDQRVISRGVVHDEVVCPLRSWDCVPRWCC